MIKIKAYNCGCEDRRQTLKVVGKGVFILIRLPFWKNELVISIMYLFSGWFFEWKYPWDSSITAIVFEDEIKTVEFLIEGVLIIYLFLSFF